MQKIPIMPKTGETHLPRTAFFELGFRPFFLGAALYAVLTMLLWMGIYVFALPLPLAAVPAQIWHAHEMIYGYGLAVVAGFLLTATRNWTGVQTLHGPSLALLFILWALARLLFFVADTLPLSLLAIVDNAFVVFLFLAVLWPVAKVRQWKQLGIIAKIALLLLSNILFYLGLLGILDEGVRWGLYSGFYTLLALILVMGRRVLPFFIEKGVGYPLVLKNNLLLDIAALVLFVAFWFTEVFIRQETLAALLAGGLFILHALRLWAWHSPGLWKKPLLWVLYLAYGAIVMGFALRFSMLFYALPAFAVIHLFALGGIAMTTLGMMARISLGHTGRDVQHPPSAVPWIFSLLLIATLFRVAFALILPHYYMAWIILSQVFWIAAFALFVLRYAAMLIRPNIN